MAGSRLSRLGTCLQGVFDSETDWVDIVAIANDYLVGPDLYRVLRRSDRAGLVDPEAMAYLEELDAANSERNARLCDQVSEIAAAFQAAGLEPLLIKGAALLVQLDDASDSSRMVGDIDLMIAAEHVAAVATVLKDLGYRAIEGTARGHSPGNFWKPSAAGSIDLHSGLPFRLAHVVSARDLRERTRPITFRGSRVRVPDAGLQLVLNIGHEMIHDEALYSGVTEARYLLELDDLIRRRRGEIDWDWIGEKRKDRGFDLAVELQARMASDLLGSDLFPGIDYSRAGFWLHKRRLLKNRFELAGRLEWSLVRRLLRFRRRSLA